MIYSKGLVVKYIDYALITLHKEWIKQYNWPEDFSDIDAIPFAETRDYVRQVLADEKKYRELYPE